MTKSTNTVASSESMMDKAMHIVDVSTEWAATSIENVATVAYTGAVSTVARTTSVVEHLVISTPSVWEQAKLKADARMAARLARYTK